MDAPRKTRNVGKPNLTPGQPEAAETKPWGWTLELWGDFETIGGRRFCITRQTKISVKPGGYSSIHKHVHQSNEFFVQDGKLKLRWYFEHDSGDGSKPVLSQQGEIVLSKGERHGFPAGIIHEFEALTPVVALETYHAERGQQALATDIIRFTQNGIKQSDK
jgi:mannose-6-phosphate isomerase-like protein (cupin superfamily)